MQIFALLLQAMMGFGGWDEGRDIDGKKRNRGRVVGGSGGGGGSGVSSLPPPPLQGMEQLQRQRGTLSKR